MSGGSYTYAYLRIEELASDIQLRDNPRRAVLKKVLRLVANACHDVEWADSGDYAQGDENNAIDALLSAVGLDPEMAAKAAAWDEARRWLLGKEKARGK